MRRGKRKGGNAVEATRKQPLGRASKLIFGSQYVEVKGLPRRTRAGGAPGKPGLPDRREVIVTPVSRRPGTPPTFACPRLKRKDGGHRRHTHAILVFDEPVCGPSVIGAGRYRGYGFCRPLNGQDETERGKKTTVVSKTNVSREAT
jgi:hypothetical protein